MMKGTPLITLAKSLIRGEEGTSEEITHVEKEKERNSRVSKIFVRFPHERVDKLHCLIVCLKCLACGPVDSQISSPPIQGCFMR